MTMTENYKIIGKYIKDLSCETPDTETYIFVRENLSKYKLSIDINSIPLKNKMVEININLKFSDQENNKKKSYFELIFTTIIRILNDNIEKNQLEKIVLCDVPNIVYPDIEKSLLDLIHNSGYADFKIEKKIDFEILYKNKINN